ncbi:MAG: arsenate reductase ArsC [Chitinophagales bacterium]
MKQIPKVLVLCTGNSCRSQMAEGYLRHFAGNRAEIYSAGVAVHGLNPMAVDIMLEDGIDISNQTSNHISEYAHLEFDFAITVCDHAAERCPVFVSRAKKSHYNFPDPAKTAGTPKTIAHQFRLVRNEIKLFCSDFVAKQLR